MENSHPPPYSQEGFTINTQQQALRSKEEEAKWKTKEIERLEAEIDRKDREIEWKTRELEWKEREMERKDKEIERKDKEVKAITTDKETSIKEKNLEIQTRGLKIEESEVSIRRLESNQTKELGPQINQGINNGGKTEHHDDKPIIAKRELLTSEPTDGCIIRCNCREVGPHPWLYCKNKLHSSYCKSECHCDKEI